MNEWKPSYLGVAVVPRTRPMAPELRGSCLARRQGSSSDLRSVREKAQIAPVRKGSTSAFKRWQARVVTEIVALAAIGPVPVAAFKKLG